MLLLSFDFGMKYIGTAVGETLTCTSRALSTLIAKDGIPNPIEIDNLINEWQPGKIIIGLPTNLDGTKQDIWFCAKKFANRLAVRYKIPIATIGEEYSTLEAKQLIKSMPLKSTATANTKTKIKTKKTKEFLKLNAMSAKIILDRWFEQENNKDQ